MRVISGRFKGHRLVPFKYKNLRPMTDFTKESLFNRLMDQIPGSRVLDLFSGTGSLSIEALSRGALEVVAVERHPLSLKVIAKNLAHLNIRGEIKVFRKDVMRFLKVYKGPPFDIILIDPPFTQQISHNIMVALSRSTLACRGKNVVIEASKKEHIEEKYGVFELSNQKNYNDKKTSFFRS